MSRTLISVAVAATWLLRPGMGVVLGAATDAKTVPGSVSYNVPESPAFTFLGVSPSEVSQPGNVRDLAAELIEGVDENGELKQGFALSFRPGYTLSKVDLQRYQQRGLGWMLYNSEVSVGTAKTSGEEGSTDLAIGLRLTLYDGGDGMANQGYATAVLANMEDCVPEGPACAPNEAEDSEICLTKRAAANKQQLACLTARSKAFREEWLDSHWNATRVSLGFATGWTAPGSFFDDMDGGGWALWLAGGTGFGKWDQLVAQLKYTGSGDDTMPDELSYGARAFLGTARFHAFAELVGKNLYDAPEGTDDSSGEWSGGVEFRVLDNTWVATGFGSGFETGEDEKVAVLMNLKWAIADDSRIERSK